MRIMFPKKLKGLIIGKGGAGMKELEDLLGEAPTMTELTDPTTLTLTGTEDVLLSTYGFIASTLGRHMDTDPPFELKEIPSAAHKKREAENPNIAVSEAFPEDEETTQQSWQNGRNAEGRTDPTQVRGRRGSSGSKRRRSHGIFVVGERTADVRGGRNQRLTSRRQWLKVRSFKQRRRNKRRTLRSRRQQERLVGATHLRILAVTSQEGIPMLPLQSHKSRSLLMVEQGQVQG